LVIPAAGGDPREVLKLKSESLSGVAWTRDGSRLLFSRAGKGKPELWRIPSQGGEPTNLGLAANENARISFHPDGRRIAFTAGETNTEVWVMENFLPDSRAAR
jgi:Tol biopolymer transport system component